MQSTNLVTNAVKTISIPVGISNRHVHLCQEDLDKLFGPGYQLTKLKDLTQTGQFAATEVVTVAGPKGVLEAVRILGPVRKETQVEISRTDTYQLGIDAPVRDSGELEGTPGTVLIGPKGIVPLEQGVIIAATHIHMHSSDAEAYHLKDTDRVQVLAKGEREICYHNVKVRVSDQFHTELHLDTDEANAALVKNGDLAVLEHRNSVVYDQEGLPREIMEFKAVEFQLLENPSSPLALEALILLRLLFGLSHEENRGVVAKLLEPQKIAPHKFYFLTAVKAEKVVGVACFYYLADVNFGYLDYIGVSPNAQEHGLGTFLYHKVIATLEQQHPDVAGLVLEVRNTEENLEYRKEFFLNVGAIPVDLSFYPSAKALADSNLILMFDPIRADICVNWPILLKTFQDLSAVLK